MIKLGVVCCELGAAGCSFIEKLNWFQWLDHFRHFLGMIIELYNTLKLQSIGGSDCHIIEHVKSAVTEFINPIQTIDDMIREIKKGNCRGVYI